MEFGKESPKPKDTDVHRIITTSFNVELNTFIANFEAKQTSFEVVRTGGLTEIRVGTYNSFAAYAYFLKNFREDLFKRSANWSFPLDSFLSDLDSLVQFYVSVFSLVETNCVREQDKETLSKKLMAPLSRFFLSMDEEFGIKYFEGRLNSIKTEPHNIVWKQVSLEEQLDKMDSAYKKRKAKESYKKSKITANITKTMKAK